MLEGRRLLTTTKFINATILKKLDYARYYVIKDLKSGLLHVMIVSPLSSTSTAIQPV
jgi:hypothetical protein